jgi:hypothetical protein
MLGGSCPDKLDLVLCGFFLIWHELIPLDDRDDARFDRTVYVAP